MRVHLCVVGRLRAGPEFDLIKDYQDRFDKTGRNLGLGPLTITEIEAKKSNMANEAALIKRAIPKGSLLLTMDERGRVLTSPEFADKLGQFRDQGQSDLAIVIGGADGIAPELRKEADFSLSFGKMVWPHMLARVMITEQLYRAASILSGNPYHRV